MERRHGARLLGRRARIFDREDQRLAPRLALIDAEARISQGDHIAQLPSLVRGQRQAFAAVDLNVFDRCTSDRVRRGGVECPFLIEGMLAGLIASLLAVVVVASGYQPFVDKVRGAVPFLPLSYDAGFATLSSTSSGTTILSFPSR